MHIQTLRRRIAMPMGQRIIVGFSSHGFVVDSWVVVVFECGESPIPLFSTSAVISSFLARFSGATGLRNEGV